MRKCSHPKRNSPSLQSIVARLAALAIFFMGTIPASRAAGAATTTTLSVAPSNTVAAGTPVTLTAAVTNPAAVSAGSVVFCDVAALNCSGPAILGSVQLTIAGTATLKLTLGVGTHQIKAVFARTNANLGSTSATQTIIVTGNATYATSMAITASGTPATTRFRRNSPPSARSRPPARFPSSISPTATP